MENDSMIEKTDINFIADINAINQIPVVDSILEVVCQTTGMGFAAIARVTKDKWIKIRTTSIKNHAAFMKKFYPDWRWYIFAAIYYTKQYGALWFGKLFKS